jgi:Ca2+-binding EF-hand superfamily protein
MFTKIVARNMTNLTPAQLEQFESTFRYFDREGNNTLSVPEMTAALASLGIVYSVSSQLYDPLSRCLAHRLTG